MLDLLDQMEDLLATSKHLENARYLPDIHVKTPRQRQEAGLALTSMVWPNAGDHLIPLPQNNPGSPFPICVRAWRAVWGSVQLSSGGLQPPLN